MAGTFLDARIVGNINSISGVTNDFSWAKESLMKIRYAVLAATIMLLSSMSLALAEDSNDGDELDATMRLMDDAEAESSETVTLKIKLPEHLMEGSVAAEKSAKGHATANDAINKRENGLRDIEEARNRANEMAEGAKENRENHGRSEDHPEPPDQPGPPN
jgi:hypothetical protein